MRKEGPKGHTLQPTALVHEAWMRLVGGRAGFDGREHFLAVAARAMRSVLVDHARRRRSQKRGGEGQRLPLDNVLPVYEERADLVALDEALNRLSVVDERRAQVVELRFFGGLTIEETAQTLKSSTATVQRNWQMARLWLLNELGPS
jgi:RNA polymerase sigma factor (TIGR02999 family)